MKLKSGLLVLAVLIGFTVHGFSQRIPAPELTLENIYGGVFGQEGYGPVRWLVDGDGYTTLERSKSVRGTDIVKYDAKSGDRSIIVDAAKLVPSGQENPLSISDYIWSPDNTKLMIFTNTRRVWRRHTRGDYWVLDLVSGKLQQLGKQVERTTMMFAKFSPDNKKVAYVSLNNIYIEDLKTEKLNQITKDGCDYIVNGTFDWVYEEELNCRDGFRWSPDSKTIAYWQSDTRGTGTFRKISIIVANWIAMQLFGNS